MAVSPSNDDGQVVRSGDGCDRTDEVGDAARLSRLPVRGRPSAMELNEENMATYIAKFRTATSERGATAVEYGLMVALIAIVIIVAVALLGGNLSGLFNQVAGSV